MAPGPVCGEALPPWMYGYRIQPRHIHIQQAEPLATFCHATTFLMVVLWLDQPTTDAHSHHRSHRLGIVHSKHPYHTATGGEAGAGRIG
ncbi:hypothetical protein BKA80DRAFT_60033 [Phyllosticta citrichinensis]